MVRELELKELLKAGAHFGHQVHRWNPRMKPYVFGERNGIYIIDLGKTIEMAKKAADFLVKITSQGKPVLFVGTKRQASDSVRKAAVDCGSFHVTHRWLGGMLTNYQTITLSVDKLRKVEKMKNTGDFTILTKKEQSKVEKEVNKLERNLGGIKDMRKLPGAVFVVDPNNERIAVLEANKLKIPVIAITDTNCDPTGIDYVVPGNDDAIKSISIFTDYFSEAIAEGSKTSVKAGTGSSEDRKNSLEREMIKQYEQKKDQEQPDKATE
ncbi:MAG: 30S ribosomal protein S2 [Bdellovibrionales bacterium]|jgi:small subunit ribosomal protein S2|nr:30S ribosomal protein S2 [Bdellovibrionales bacterium]MBT3526504.1 30S ribosomal protein S2 [Bdellovibrionales bacterium]MBT7670038.1 30S ribosomal protein S2 [Bdellovibrionales bacterium]MBT7767788.1 30S ribosomal protein S2 [Bdellovibrionales bacterium]